VNGETVSDVSLGSQVSSQIAQGRQADISMSIEPSLNYFIV